MALALSMTRDKTAVWFITVVEADGTTPQNLTTATLYFHASVGGVDIDKSSPSSGITITAALLGTATLTIDPADTTDIPFGGVYSGSCELTLVAGSASYELNSGSLTVSSNVGTP